MKVTQALFIALTVGMLATCALFAPYETVSYSFSDIPAGAGFAVTVNGVTIDGLPVDAGVLLTAQEIAASEAVNAGITTGSRATVMIDVSQTQFTADLRTRNSVVVVARIFDSSDQALHRVITTAVMSATVASPHPLRELLRETLMQLASDISEAGSLP